MEELLHLFRNSVIFGITLVITAIIIAVITFKNRTRTDAIIGMMWASGMAYWYIFVFQ